MSPRVFKLALITLTSFIIAMPAFAGTFYVRPDGNDLNLGTENTPLGAWATIQKAANTLNPGDIVEVQPGTYNEQVTITRSGNTLAQQIVFAASGEVIIDGQNTRPYCIKLDGADYIRIQSFTIRNATDNGILLDNGANSNIIVNNTCYNNGASGIRLNNTSNNNIISNNTCYSNGYGTSAYGDRPCGIYLFNSSNSNTLNSNICRNNSSTGIWLEGSSSYCTITNNKTYSNGWGGIIVVGGTNYNTVSYNLIYSNGAMGVDLSYSAHDNLFTNNTIYNNGTNGIQSNNTGYSNTLKNNIIFNNGLNSSYAYGISIETGSSSTSIYNDIYNNGLNGVRNYSGLSVGPGDISLDPLFKSTDSQSPDFLKLKSLAAGDDKESPCIDSGDPKDTPSVQSGKRIDIGAFDLYQHSPIQGGLTAEYFDNTTFTNLKLARIDPRINFDWGNNTPDSSLGVDTFSARRTGLIKIDYAQTYTFYLTTDDGSRLYIDNNLIIDKWFDQGPNEYSATINLTPGLHDIKYEYYENGGWAVAKLYWSSPSISKTPVPYDHLYYFGQSSQDKYIQGGLKGTYNKFTDLNTTPSYVFTRIDPQINFDWGNNMPDSALGQDLYQAKWKGKIRISAADTYTFYTTTDDGVKLWVNNLVITDGWYDQGATERSGSIYLAPGLYDIELNYYENGGSAVCKLLWSSTTITKQVVPPTFLYYKNDLIIEEGGLYAEYYDNIDLTSPKIKRIDPNIDFDWQSATPDKLIQSDTFSVRWTGQVKADYSEVYTFYANSDDGLKLWVDNQLLISAWWDHGAYEISAPINLTAGWHDIKVEYFENGGHAIARLFYSSPSTPKTVIPQDHLRTTLSAEEVSLNFYSTLDSTETFQPPQMGHSGSIIQTGTGQVTFEWAKFGKGALLNGTADGNNDELIQLSSSDLNKKEGTIEFWFKPNWNSDDGIWHHILTTDFNLNGSLEILKYSDNTLVWKIVKDGVQHAIMSNTARMWDANTWHNLAVSYGSQGMKFYLDYQELPISWTFHGESPYAGPLPDTFTSDIYLGATSWGQAPADAIYDDLKIHNKQIVPSDTKAPVFTITSHQDNQTVNSSPIIVSGTIDDNTAVVTVNGQNATVGEGIFTSQPINLVLGQNPVTVDAVDQSSNPSSQPITLIYVDITPPATPTVNPAVSPTNVNTQQLSGTKETNSSIWINGVERVALDGQAVWSCQVNLSEGINNFTITSKDASGNESGATVATIFLDTTLPTGTIKINNDDQYTNLVNVTFNLFATDTGTGVTGMKFSDREDFWTLEPPLDYTTSYPWTLSGGDGAKTIYARFYDAAGNSSIIVNDTIILDTVAPAVPTINTLTSPTNINSQTITGTKSEDTATITVTCPTATVGEVTYPTSTTWSCQLTNLSEGNNDITVKAFDAAGNESPAASGTIVLDTIAPAQPTIDPVTSPTNINFQTITGTKSEDTTAIIVSCPTATVGEVTYPTTTTWSCPLTNLSVGDNNITVTAFDSVENPSIPNLTTIVYQPFVPLSIEIASPPIDGSITKVSPITVSGTVSDPTATVTVNDISVPVIGNTFSADVPLTAGIINVITARAIKDLQDVNDVINIRYDPDFYSTEVLEDFDGENGRVEMWWNGDGNIVYTRSLDNSIFRSGATSMKVVYNKSGYPLSFFAVQPKRNGTDNDFSKYDKFSFWVYTQDANLALSVTFKDGDGTTYEQSFSSGAQGLWQRFICDFNVFPPELDLANIYDIMFVAAPNDPNASGSFYIDDLWLHSTEPYFYPPLTVSTITAPTPPIYDNYRINWGAVPGATIYELCESTSSDFQNANHYWGNNLYRDFSKVPPSTYYYKVRAWSNVPEEGGVSGDWSDYIVVEIVDRPPVISEVRSSVGADSDNAYLIGSIVKIKIKEAYDATDIVSGTVRITSASQGYDSGLLATTKSQDGSHYFYNWDTTGLNAAADYIIATTLTDVYSQTDIDGSDQDPDLTITLTLGTPSRYASNLETDIFIPARGLPLKFERYYLSDMKHDSPIGYNWTHNYYMRIVEIEDGNIELWDERDQYNFFSKNLDGSYNSPVGRNYTLIKNADGTFTFKKPDNITYNFNSDNKLSSIQDLNGNQITLSYNANKLLSTVTDASGRQLIFDYYGYNKIRSITDFTGRAVNYEYVGSDLTKVTNQAQLSTSYQYTSHLLTTITNPRGYHTYFTYIGTKLLSKFNDNGIHNIEYSSLPNPNRLIATNARGYQTTYTEQDATHSLITDARGNATSITLDNRNNPLYVTDAAVHTSSYTWDSRDNLLTQKDPYNNTTTYTYHPTFNKVTSVTDANNNTTIFTYDQNGNLTAIEDPYDSLTTIAYDQYGQITQTTDKNGNITRYEYNLNGDVTKITKQMGPAPDSDIDLITTMQYDARGNLINLTDPMGNMTTFDYDVLDRLIRTTDSLGNKVEYTYDQNSNVTFIAYKDPSGATLQTVTKTYDKVDRPKTVTDHAGNTTTYDYDNNSNLIRMTDVLGNMTTFAYNEVDLLASKTDDLGNATIYEYNEISKLWWVKDANEHMTTYTYDDAARIKTVRYPDLSQETYDEYDNVGNIFKKINRAGELISYTYDKLNQLKTKTYPDASTVTYSYDDGSRLLSAIDSNGTTSYSYDKADRLISVTDVYNKVVSYEYDKASNRTKLTYPDTTYITYAYDALNRLEYIKNPSGANIAAYDYDDLSRRTSLILENGTQTTYAYDDINRLTNLVNKKITSETILSSFGYGYDDVGNRLSKTTQEGAFSYVYNDIYELKEVRDPQSHVTTYNYDGVANRTTVINGTTTTYIPNELNQYISVNSVTYDYDLKGNLTSDGVSTYTYDFENRLVSVIPAQAGIQASYTYDYSGRRISKTLDGVTTRYIYDNTDIIAEYDVSNNLLRKFIHGEGVDEPLVMDALTTKYYYHTDALGSITEITDSSANIIEKYTYDAYGNVIIKDGNNNVLSQSAINNRYTYTARELDPETGLYYYRARYYSSKIGRFLQTDPIGYYDSMNLYQYCGNNPVNFVDPMGLCKEQERLDSFTEKIRDKGYSVRYQAANSTGGYVDWLLSEISRMVALFQGRYASSMGGRLVGQGPSYEDTQYYQWLLLQYVDATMGGMSTSVPPPPKVQIGQKGIHGFIKIGEQTWGYGPRGIRSPDDYGTGKASYKNINADPDIVKENIRGMSNSGNWEAKDYIFTIHDCWDFVTKAVGF